MQSSLERTGWAEVSSCIHSLWVAGGGGGLVAKSCLTLAIPWTVARQAPLSMRFSRQEYWSGLPFSSPGDLPDPGVKPGSPALQADSFPTELQWVAGGLINGQVHPLRAGGRQRAGRPLEEQEGMVGPILHLPSVSWGTAPWLWDRGTSMHRQTGVKKNPHRASTAGHQVGVQMNWKG